MLADCFFDPATALCLKPVTTPEPAQPLTARFRPAWEHAAHEVGALLKERRLADLQHVALTTQLHRLTTVIEAIDPAPPGTFPG